MDIDFKATILLIAAASDSLVLLEQLLQERYHVKLARCASDARPLIEQAGGPDLIVLDAGVAGQVGADGFTELEALRRNFLASDIAVLMLVDGANPEQEQRALAAGASDVVAKPVAPATLLARVAIQLQLRFARSMLKDQQGHVEHLVAERTRAASALQDATVMAMAALAESRDAGVGRHLRRTQHYVAALARELRFQAAYTAELSNENIDLLFKAAPLHDIGKVGVPDAILLKPGKLTDSEFAHMKLHTVYGRDAIAGVEQTLGSSNQFLRYAREITYSHQEKWDGSGYPQGLQADAIPLAARLMAVADVYDALISARSYRPAFTHETAVELIRQGRGEHFDPDVVDAMLAIEDKFRDIAARFAPQ